MIARLQIDERWRLHFAGLADCSAAAVAALLPWSTSATGVLLAIWFVAVLPALNWSDVRKELRTAAGGLPVLLCLFGVVGTAWAFGVPVDERLKGAISFLRLLVVPLLFVQFRNSPRGHWVLIALFTSCLALLLASYATDLWPQFRPGHPAGQPVKNYISQSMFFMMCALAMVHVAFLSWQGRRQFRFLMCLAIAAAFFVNIIFVAASRTTLLLIPLLLLVWAYRQFGVKGTAIAAAAVVFGCLGVWSSSQYLRDRIVQAVSEVSRYEATDQLTSSGARLEFWKKSLGFVAAAPVIGHGTGSIHREFEKAAYGPPGSASAVPSTNPHNQTLTVAIQLGFVGVVVLWAMWVAQLLLFTGSGTVAWFGLLLVLQHIGGSVFNSFLFDFTEGWFYVFGVGVLGGMIKRERAIAKGGPVFQAQ